MVVVVVGGWGGGCAQDKWFKRGKAEGTRRRRGCELPHAQAGIHFEAHCLRPETCQIPPKQMMPSKLRSVPDFSYSGYFLFPSLFTPKDEDKDTIRLRTFRTHMAPAWGGGGDPDVLSVFKISHESTALMWR